MRCLLLWRESPPVNPVQVRYCPDSLAARLTTLIAIGSLTVRAERIEALHNIWLLCLFWSLHWLIRLKPYKECFHLGHCWLRSQEFNVFLRKPCSVTYDGCGLGDKPTYILELRLILIG